MRSVVRHLKYYLSISAVTMYRSDFENSSSGAYDAALNNKWLDKVCSHMRPKPKVKNSKK
jgi:hypothetical protein